MSIAREFANPEVAKHLQFYPEETDGPISEVWQAECWKEFDLSQLTPMYSRGLRQFYIEELAQLQDGCYVIPYNWVIRGRYLHADCHEANPTLNGWTLSSTSRSIPASQFQFNYEDLVARMGDTNIQWADNTVVAPMPHPLRKLADGDDLYVVMVPVWADNVSSNKSKQYNKHINLYMVNSCLPGQLLQQEYFIRFVSTSPHATSPEQFAALRDQVCDTETNPLFLLTIHNSWRKLLIWVEMRTKAVASVMQEGPMSIQNQMMAMMLCITLEGVLHTAQEIRDKLHAQLRQAMNGVEKSVSEMQTASGIKDKVAQHWIEQLLVKAKEIKQADPGRSQESVIEELQKWLDEQPGDKINPLLNIAGLDPSQDTPVEILHTILLGIIKYIWHMLHTSMSDADPYMMQYHNNLIGKHFKTLMQTLPFLVHDIVTPAQFNLVKAAGALGALLWVHEIEDMNEYLKDLNILIGNVLDAFGAVDPSKILIKIKLHLLPHLVNDIHRFGPAIRYSTEVFERYNAIFRLCSVYSNHQAPSRDIALKFSKRWIQAGKSVLCLLHSEPVIQRHLGWVPPVKLTPGLIHIQSKKRAVPMSWSTTLASRYLSAETLPLSSLWHHGSMVTAQSSDRCAIGSWVIFQNHDAGISSVGHIKELLVHEKGATHAEQLVTIEAFVLGDSRHPDFGCPVLQKADPSEGNDSIVINLEEKRKATIALNQAKKQSVEAAINWGQIAGQDPDDEMEIILDEEKGDRNETPPIQKRQRRQ
ncbi:hypothetical protein EV421DRAFT_1912712 [Armillaria borealis]|uniref:Uncharacterized protein n=1 Tax=Armillaria borealis TaxID=47425 RepID=A0AA39MDT9_9AGAR|nr:hypothetical protein EV421DRAFT_1912712 [Armillaria borealis]